MNDPQFANNPWSAEHWNLTRQGAYVRRYGIEVAKTKAREAGVTLFGSRPYPCNRPYTVIVQRRNIVADAPQGYAGDGPPDAGF